MILVTGATGIIGSHIAVELIKQKFPIRLLVRPHSNRIALYQLLSFHGLSDENITFVEGDVNDPISLDQAVKGCSRVYHCAAKVSFDPGDERSLFETNIAGTSHVVDACLSENAAMTYISSTAAIGDQKINNAYTEESIWTKDRGRSAYAISKRYAELEVFRGIQEGLNATIVNPGVVIGPGNWGQSSTSIFMSAKGGMRFYPSGSNGFVDARDVAEIAISLSQKEDVSGRHLLIGQNTSFQNVFSTISRAFSKPIPSVQIPKRPVLWIAHFLRIFEKIGLRPLSITSENLKSAYRESHYASDKIRSLGYRFRGLKEAVEYTKAVYDQSADQAIAH